ncbi:MAG: hypothetical protein AAGI46_06320 [Planctomycetota bacterium]
MPIVATGCFTPSATKCIVNDASPLYRELRIAESAEGALLAVPCRITRVRVLSQRSDVGRRFVYLPLTAESEPPSDLRVTQDEAIRLADVSDAQRLAGVHRVTPSQAAAVGKFRQNARAIRDDAAWAGAEPVASRAELLNDDVVLVAYGKPGKSPPTARPTHASPRADWSTFDHFILMPTTFETTGGDKVARATVGIAAWPIALVGDAAVVVAGAGVTAGLVVAAVPVFAVRALLDELDN